MAMPPLQLSAQATSGATGGRAGGDQGDWIVSFGDKSPVGGIDVPWWFWAGLAVAAVAWAKKRG